jgi:hypothetical protein
MKKLFIIALALGFTFYILPANPTQQKKAKPASSDTTSFQRNKSKKQLYKQKSKEHKPVKKGRGSVKPDSIKINMVNPIL